MIISPITMIFQFDLINAKKREKKGYKNSGQIVVKSVKIEQVYIECVHIKKGFKGFMT